MADPVAAGVVKSAQDSGVDNFTCRVEVDRWSSMFRVFYDVVRFHKMGIMFQNSQEGRVYAALGDAQAIASELGFSLVLYDGLSSAESAEECRKGLDDLRKQGMLADNTGRPYKDIVKATERDNFLTPEEAKELGIIDRVLVSRNEMAQEKSE